MQNELTAERIERSINYMAEMRRLCDTQTGNVPKAYDTALAALRAEQERLNPQPLTVEEMNELNEEPVYIMHVDTIKNGAKTWLAYRTKPEGSAE